MHRKQESEQKSAILQANNYKSSTVGWWGLDVVARILEWLNNMDWPWVFIQWRGVGTRLLTAPGMQAGLYEIGS